MNLEYKFDKFWQTSVDSVKDKVELRTECEVIGVTWGGVEIEIRSAIRDSMYDFIIEEINA